MGSVSHHPMVTNASSVVQKSDHCSALDVARRLVGQDDCSTDEDENLHVAPPDPDLHTIQARHNVKKSLDALDIKNCVDLEEDSSSCLGSSVSCSEASFELAHMEDSKPPLASRDIPAPQAKPAKSQHLHKNDQQINYRSVQQPQNCTMQNNAKDGGRRPSRACCIQKIVTTCEATKATVCRNDTRDFDGNAERYKNENGPSTAAELSLTPNNNCGRLASVDEELSKLDTNLPSLDFDLLQRHLTDALNERRMINERQFLSEEVRRRLALDYCSETEPEFGDSEVEYESSTRHQRPNKKRALKMRKKSSNTNLEICFVNDGLPSDEDDDDWMQGVSKSISAPNLGFDFGHGSLDRPKNGKLLERSVSSYSHGACHSNDSEMRASELRKAASERQALEDVDAETCKNRLQSEAKVMLTKAKQAARMQMELEKQSRLKRSKSAVEEIIGFTIGKRKLTRAQLSKMCVTQLLIIINDLHSRIQTYNEELVHLLVERDTLHMEQDSKLVDVQDLVQHQRNEDLKLPDFLTKIVDVNENLRNGLKNGLSNGARRLRLKLFRK